MKPRFILGLSAIAIALSSAHAATYNWIGTTSDFNAPSNWVENDWTQWGDYRFGADAVSGAVNLDDFFGGGNWFLDSGLGFDITLTGSQPLISQSISGNGGNITIDTLSRDLDIQCEYISVGPVTWNIGAGRSLSMSGQLANWYGAASLVKQGPGIAILKTANSYTGGTTLSGGILRLDNTSALGSGSLSIADGTTLQLRADADATFNGGNNLGGVGNSAITIDVNQLSAGNTDKTLSFATGGFDTFNTTINATGGNGYTLALGGINNGYGGPLTLMADSANLTIGAIGSSSATSSLTVGGASSTTITGAVTSSGGLTKNDSGTLTLTAINNYSGDTTLNGGTLSLGDGTSSTNLPDAAALNIAFGTTLNLNFTGTDVVGKLIIDGATVPSGVYDGTLATPEEFRSYFTGGGSLTVLNESGTWISAVDGTWSDSANWLSSVIANGSDKTATFSAGTGSETIIVTLDAAREIGNLAFSNANYTISGGNTLTLDVTSTSVPAISVESGLDATISASLAGSLGLEKSGAGSLALTGANTFAGETLVTGGLLQLGAGVGSNPQFGALENSSLLTIGSGATVRAMGANAFKGWSGGIMDVTLNGGTLMLNDGLTAGGNHNLGFVVLNGGTISGTGNATFGGFVLTSLVEVTENSVISSSNTHTNGNTCTVNVSTGKSLDWSGSITNGYLNSPSSFVFEGEGTTLLSGINSYTGNTTVNDGILELAENAQLTFAVTDAPASTVVTGSGTATFGGVFNIDTSGVSGSTSQTWLLVDRANLVDESFTSSFSVNGFSDPEADGTWIMSDAKGDWSFSEDSGELTFIAGSDYDTWKSDNGVTGGDNDDDDHDGLTNFEEYAFGLDPTGGTSVNPITVQLDKSTGTFSYTRRDPSLTDLTYSVWYSTDLSVWTQDTGAVPGTPATSGEVETVPVTISGALLANPKLFIQVRAE